MTSPAPLLIALGLLLMAGCTEEPADQCMADATPLQLGIPDHFPIMDIPADNPLTEQGVALGRRLYHDPLLSQGGPQNGRSCSSCHFQPGGFSLSGPGMSVLPHVNLGWNDVFLWEGKVEGQLEDIMRFEVEEFFQSDLELLRSDPVYPEMFRKAFGECEITTELVTKAMAQWFRRLVSTNNRYDRYATYQLQLTDAELRGMTIFLTEKGDCFHCHIPPLFTDNSFHNNGIDSLVEGEDRGRYNVTHHTTDLGLFKTPTLRNVALTAPYMHDGRFATLEEVVEHYNSGVRRPANVDPIMTKPGKEYGLGLTEQDKADLVAFLTALSDETFISDTALSSPF
ncbi:MAG: cytochrome-c peroxidase [Flavobacteriales bacterium]|nr:cytochrome-c peroxidase [Flavobacteriales bacterium]